MSRRGRGDTLTLARDLAAGRTSPIPPKPQRQRAIKLSAESCQFVGPGNLAPEDAQRAWFADMLWCAFPAESMTAVSKIAAEWLTENGFPTSERQVRYWLKCEHTAGFAAVNAVLSQVELKQGSTVMRRRE